MERVGEARLAQDAQIQSRFLAGWNTTLNTNLMFRYPRPHERGEGSPHPRRRQGSRQGQHLEAAGPVRWLRVPTTHEDAELSP